MAYDYDQTDRTPVQWPIKKSTLKSLKQIKARSSFTKMPDLIEAILEEYIKQTDAGALVPGAVSEAAFLELQSTVENLQQQLESLSPPSTQVEWSNLKAMAFPQLKVFASKFDVNGSTPDELLRELSKCDKLLINGIPGNNRF